MSSTGDLPPCPEFVAACERGDVFQRSPRPLGPDGFTPLVPEGVENARRAEQAERRAEDAEAAFERLRAAADKVGHQAVCPVDPCDCWMRDLAPLLDGGSDGGVCPDCAGEWGKPMREGCKRPWHHADEWQWEQVAETTQGSGDDAWSVGVFRERGWCDHQWIDRPESDTSACDLCGEER